MYSQGFHQPLVITNLNPSITPLGRYIITVYPNPVPATLNITIQSVFDGKVNLTLLDARGHVAYTGVTTSKASLIKINMLAFAAGVYILKVTNTSGVTIGTYKIVKAS